MRVPSYSRQFKQDVKTAQKRHKDISKLKDAISSLVEERELAHRRKDHPLRGHFADYRECHIEPDWLLIYKVAPGKILFVRTGTHSDLF